MRRTSALGVPSARETSTQWPPGLRLERRDAEVSEHDVVARERELRADEDHVHRQAPAAALDEELLRARHRLGGGPAGRVRLAERVEAFGVDADALAHGLELRIRLHRARMVELDVPRDEVRGVAQRGEVRGRS
jgi:hypothetical protein